jgi:hypothetical protein
MDNLSIQVRREHRNLRPSYAILSPIYQFCTTFQGAENKFIESGEIRVYSHCMHCGRQGTGHQRADMDRHSYVHHIVLRHNCTSPCKSPAININQIVLSQGFRSHGNDTRIRHYEV